MNKQPDNSARENGNGVLETDNKQIPPEKLLEFAREYFATNFPNPDRCGCPDRIMLDSLARLGRLPDDQLRAHLFSCSECFTEYRMVLPTRAAAEFVASWLIAWQKLI